MNYTANDFDTIRERIKQIKAVASGTLPPFTSGSSMAGSHCPWCPNPPDGPCPNPCSAEYEKAYGINPYGTPEERKAAGTMPPEPTCD